MEVYGAIPLKKHFSQDIGLLSSNFHLEFERGGKKNTNCWVLFGSKKTFTMSETSYTLYDQRYRITASSGHFLFSLEASTTQLTG